MKHLPIITVLLASGAFTAQAKWPKGAVPLASATLQSKSGSNATGIVDFAKEPKSLLVRVYAQNLAPGPHGVHVHENGDFSAEDASSAGGHFNPTEDKHGSPKADHRHLGDFGNLQVPVKKATAPIELRIPNPSEGPKAWDALVGRSIVIHAKADDLKSSPAGDSGERIACGVIEPAKP